MATSSPHPPYRLPEDDAFLYATIWDEDIKNLFTKEVEVLQMRKISFFVEEGHKGFCKKIERIPTEFNRQKNSCSLNLSFMGK